MKKQYIKLNNNDEHLSIGNLFRIIKETSKNKTSALQTELFCIIFDLESINDTTVNNYCVGCRSIGSEYKQIFLNKMKRYNKDKNEFADNIISILNIIDGVVHSVKDKKIEFINESESAFDLSTRLYNLAKNDVKVDHDLTDKVHSYIRKHNYYEVLIHILNFIILYKKQPLYEDELKREVINNVLSDTSISSIDLEEFLSLKLREGINYDFMMKKLALKGNAYANFELGSSEYYGYVKGYPRYDMAYKYLVIAAQMNHASANYMIGSMFIKGLIGSKTNEELKCGYEYLVKSYNLGNVAACNTIGNMYYEGIYPLNKDLKEAIKYYEEAAHKNFAFALNNLGKISEKNKDFDKAFAYYLKAADLGESWACNKVGEWYRLGTIEHNMKASFYYYNRALESNYRTLCFYAYYNLAKYFYYNGNALANVDKDERIALDYLEEASNNGLFVATLELFYIYVVKYLNNKNPDLLNMVMKYKEKIENSHEYNDEIREIIENKLKELKNVKKINIECLD